MRTLAWICVLTCGLVAWPANAADDGKPTVAFVGKLIAIRALPDPCENAPGPADGSMACITFDATFQATYEVVEVLTGNPERKVVDLHVADHYGFPSFAEYQHALLFVGQDAQGGYVHKYQGFAVHRTVDSGWATCGTPDFGDEDTWRPAMRPLAFANALRDLGESSEAAIAQQFDGWPVVVEDGQVRCTQGIPVRDVYELVRKGVMAARGVALPPL